MTAFPKSKMTNDHDQMTTYQRIRFLILGLPGSKTVPIIPSRGLIFYQTLYQTLNF